VPKSAVDGTKSAVEGRKKSHTPSKIAKNIFVKTIVKNNYGKLLCQKKFPKT
jgi:hypothetical protein